MGGLQGFRWGVVLLLFVLAACGSSKDPGSASIAPEILLQESLKNIGTLVAEAGSEFLTANVGSAKSAATASLSCPGTISHENECLKLVGSCAADGPKLALNGFVEFKDCLRATELGISVFSGEVAFQANWTLPASCLTSTSTRPCPAALVELTLTDPSGLSVRFAEAEAIGLTSLRAFLSEVWRLASFGVWKLRIEELNVVMAGASYRCLGDPLACTAIQQGPGENQAADPACLDIPDCDSDAVCEDWLGACPDTASLLGDFGHELRCLDSQSRPGTKSCLPVKAVVPPPDDEEPPVGSCARTAGWDNYCPITIATTINGEGLDCSADTDCQSREFSVNFGGPCNSPCFYCQFYNTECESCDACRVLHRCSGGCCAFDGDQDGFVDVGSVGGGFQDMQLLAKEDNCNYQTNAEQTDADLDCIGDACDNCRTAINGLQEDHDLDGIGTACDNCPIVRNGPNPIIVCDDKGCHQVPSSDNQTDSDGDGVGDACQGDYDGDGVPDESDNCPRLQGVPPASADQTDGDGDGVGDLCDNCRRTPNSDQVDLINDGGDPFPDGRGDACQGDFDEDGDPDQSDNCIFDYNPDQANGDGDPFGDACDVCPADYSQFNVPWACGEPDGDGVANTSDNCPMQFNPGQEAYAEGGGFPGQACSFCLMSQSPWGLDPDADGVQNSFECDNCSNHANADQKDGDGDLIGDLCDNCPYVPNFGQKDTDSDGIGDACAFCDDNGSCGEQENFFNCPSDCPPSCGNGVLENPVEGCDDGNLTDGDGCDGNCTLTACGNGILTEGESCGEPGAPTCAEGQYCKDCGCKTPLCGDGILDPNENCDDGNLDPNDFCTDGCVPNVCGDGVVNSFSEQCDGDDGVCQEAPGTFARYCDALQCRCVNFCGDGVCDPAQESAANCYVDCMSCGDGVCDPIADGEGCADCDAAPPSCGDRICDGAETVFNCFPDCKAGCGDGICDDRESSLTCYGDCRICGDGYCDATVGEDGDNCPQDFCAFTADTCGDGVCEDTMCDESTPTCEFIRTCYGDCAFCGDQLCDAARGENATTCSVDCQPIVKPPTPKG